MFKRKIFLYDVGINIKLFFAYLLEEIRNVVRAKNGFRVACAPPFIGFEHREVLFRALLGSSFKAVDKAPYVLR